MNSSVNVDGVTNAETVVDNEKNAGETVYSEVVSKPKAKDEKKPVAFLMDIESKAIVESIVDLEDFSVSNLMKVLQSL